MKLLFSIGFRHQLGLGIVLVLSVALVTVLFNFVGTLSCCVLVGMMCGASWRWQWQMVPVSLAFPAVLLALAPIPKVGLPLHETIQLSKEERNFCPPALAEDGAYPFDLHGPRTVTAFAAADDPMNPVQRHLIQRPNQRLAR